MHFFCFVILECIQLIEQCLSIRSSERPTLEQCLQSEWLKYPSLRDLTLSLVPRKRSGRQSLSSSSSSKLTKYYSYRGKSL